MIWHDLGLLSGFSVIDHGRASCKVPCVVREQWEATLDVLSTAGFL